MLSSGSQTRPRLLLCGATVGAGLVVAGLSLWPGLAVPKGAPAFSDLVIHAAIHGGYGTLAFLGWSDRRYRVLAVLIALGGMFEVCQIWVPGRVFDLADLAANLTGVAGAALVTSAPVLMVLKRGVRIVLRPDPPA